MIPHIIRYTYDIATAHYALRTGIGHEPALLAFIIAVS